MKKIMAGAMLLTLLTGCGTVMESHRKPVNVTSNHRAKVEYDGFVEGTGKHVYVNASNRSKGQSKQIVATSLKTGEVRIIQPTYTGNGWILANLFIDAGILSIPIDLINGSHKKLDRQNYYIEFDDEYTEEETLPEVSVK